MREGRPRPGFGVTLFAILLPIALMLGATAAAVMWPGGGSAAHGGRVRGQPHRGDDCGRSRRRSRCSAWRAAARRTEILRFSEECLAPVASVLLVVGAGGGFGRVLDAAGVGSAVHDAASGLRLSPLLLGWLIAALLRVAVGSATVAIVTAAGIMAPVAAAVPDTNRELLVIALGAGSIVASHVNDGGFWLVKEYFNLSVVQTLRRGRCSRPRPSSLSAWCSPLALFVGLSSAALRAAGTAMQAATRTDSHSGPHSGPMLIFDAHLDLAMNALEWNRDFSRPIDEIRARERGMTDKPDRGHGTVAFPRCGGAASAVRRDADRALCAPGQPAARLALAGAGLGDDAGPARLVSRDGGARRAACRCATRAALERHLEAWQSATAASAPIGYVLSLEGADSIVSIAAPRACVRARPARGRAGALRPGHLRAGHRRERRHRRARPRAAARRWSGSA